MPQKELRMASWGYVVLLAGFTHRFLTYGTVKSLGILVPYLADELSASYTTVGFLCSLEHTMCLVMCPIANSVQKCINPRMLTIVSGLGGGLCFILLSFARSTWLIGVLFVFAGTCSAPFFQVVSIVMRQYFGDRFGFANAVTHLGSVVGSLLLPLVTAELFDAYGLWGTFLCLGALLLNRCPAGGVLRPPPDPHEQVVIEGREVEDAAATNRSSKGDDRRRISIANCWRWFYLVLDVFDLPSIAREWRVTLFFLPSTLFVDITVFGWSLFVPSYGLSVGFDESLVTYLPMTGALGGIVSRIILVFLLYHKPHWSPHLYIANALVAAIAFLVYPLNSSFVFSLVCSFAAGFGLFGSLSSHAAALSLFVSRRNFPGIIAVSFFMTGAGAVISGTLTGFLYDVTGSFLVVFRIYAGMCFAICILIALSLKFRKTQETITL